MSKVFQTFILFLVLSISFPNSSRAECIDPDGDGYGLNGNRPCRTRRTKSTGSGKIPVFNVGNVSVSNLTGSSAKISATFSQRASGRIFFGKTPQFGRVGPYSGFFKRTNFNQTLSNLEPNTTYHFKVEARDGRKKASSSVGTFRTNGVVATTTTLVRNTSTTMPIQQVELLGAPSHVADMRDARISFAFSDVAQAQLEYGTSKSNTKLGVKESSFIHKTHEQKLHNLEPETLYYYRVLFSGLDVGSKNLVSDWYSFTTKESFGNHGVVSDPIEQRDKSQRATLGTASMGTWSSEKPPSGKNRWLRVPVEPDNFYGIGLKNPVMPKSTEGWISYNIRLVNWNKSKHGMKLPGPGAGITGSGGSKPESEWIGGQGGGGAGGTTGGPDGKGKSWSARMAIYGVNNDSSVHSKGRLVYELYHRDSTNRPEKQPARQYGEQERWDAFILDEKWHHIKHYVMLNDIGKANGILRGYFDGKLAYERHGISFADNPKYRNIAVMLNVYHGGAIPATDYFEVYLDDIHWIQGSE